MASTILTSTEVTREALRLLHNKANFIKAVDRQFDSSFAKSGAKIGDTLKVRLPNEYTVRTGKAIAVQDTVEDSVSVQVATQKGVDMNFSSQDLTLSLDDFSKRILTPAMSRLVGEMEKDGLALYKDVYNLVGTSGTTPATALVFLEAGQKLDETLTLRDADRKMIVNPKTNATMVDALKGLFHKSDNIEEQYESGEIGTGLGFKWSMSAIVNTHTCGTRDNTTPLTNAATAQTGASLICDGFDSSATVTAGDVFTIAGVYAINPETKQAYDSLQQFVVTAAGTASGGALTMSISPSIVASGAKQNVSAAAANDAAITFVGTASTAYPQMLAFHKEAFTLVTADLVMPQGIDFASRQNYDGVSLRIVRQYDINNDNFPCRLDVLYGWKTVKAQFACRVTG